MYVWLGGDFAGVEKSHGPHPLYETLTYMYVLSQRFVVSARCVSSHTTHDMHCLHKQDPVWTNSTCLQYGSCMS